METATIAQKTFLQKIEDFGKEFTQTFSGISLTENSLIPKEKAWHFHFGTRHSIDNGQLDYFFTKYFREHFQYEARKVGKFQNIIKETNQTYQVFRGADVIGHIQIANWSPCLLPGGLNAGLWITISEHQEFIHHAKGIVSYIIEHSDDAQCNRNFEDNPSQKKFVLTSKRGISNDEILESFNIFCDRLGYSVKKEAGGYGVYYSNELVGTAVISNNTCLGGNDCPDDTVYLTLRNFPDNS